MFLCWLRLEHLLPSECVLIGLSLGVYSHWHLSLRRMVVSLPDPSWNTDQGVQHVRKSLGSTKPKGEMKVKVTARWLRCDPDAFWSGATLSGHNYFVMWPRKSVHVGTRKMVNYAWAGWSQRKLWWRSVAVLTCKSIVKLGYRGERLIEPSSSWFPPKFPSG